MPDNTRHSMRRPHALSYDDDHEVECYQQCPHCGDFWKYEKGSGRKHKFCMNCMANTCSKKWCMTHCVPLEKRLSLYEAGKIIDPFSNEPQI